MSRKNLRFAIFDLDGTLLNDRKLISPRNVDALRAWHSRGGGIILASARPPRMVGVGGVDLADYTICYNGAMTFKGHEMVRSRTTPYQSVFPILLRIVALCPEVFIALEVDDTLYANSPPERLFGTVPWKALSLDGMPPQAEVAKIIVENDPRLESLFSELDSHAVFITDQRRVAQIAAPGTDKKTAIDGVLGAERCDWGQCIAFGDDNNDLEMLRAAGISVAMGNAVEIVKMSCTLQTISNNEDGVAVILEQMMDA